MNFKKIKNINDVRIGDILEYTPPNNLNTKRVFKVYKIDNRIRANLSLNDSHTKFDDIEHKLIIAEENFINRWKFIKSRKQELRIMNSATNYKFLND